MAALRSVGSLLILFALALALLFFSSSLVLCDDKEDNVLQGINSYRTSQNLAVLAKNDKADCVADELADKLEDEPCTGNNGVNAAPANDPKLANYPNILSKCKIDVNSTRDGATMPVCVRKLVLTLVLTNYTRTRYARSLNDSRFTGVGVGSEGDWMVVVLTTNTPGGSFVSAAAGREGTRVASFAHCMLFLFTSLLFLPTV